MPRAEDVLRRFVHRTQVPEIAEAHSAYLCTKQTVTEDFDISGHLTNRKVRVGEACPAGGGTMDANKWGSENGVSLDEDLLRRFEFTVAGREQLNGRSTFHLEFVPRQPAPAIHHFQDRLLNRAMGSVWIDEEDYDLAKATISLSEPVSFGILGAIDAFTFAFERARADDGHWLTRWTETVFRARKFLKPIQSRKRVDWTGFRKASNAG